MFRFPPMVRCPGSRSVSSLVVSGRPGGTRLFVIATNARASILCRSPHLPWRSTSNPKRAKSRTLNASRPGRLFGTNGTEVLRTRLAEPLQFEDNYTFNAFGPKTRPMSVS